MCVCVRPYRYQVLQLFDNISDSLGCSMIVLYIPPYWTGARTNRQGRQLILLREEEKQPVASLSTLRGSL